MDDIYRIVLENQDGHLRNQSFIPLTEKIKTWNHCQIYRVPTQFLALFHCTGQYIHTPLAWVLSLLLVLTLISIFCMKTICSGEQA